MKAWWRSRHFGLLPAVELAIAIDQGDAEALARCLRWCIRPGGFLLVRAARQGDLRLVALLIEHGADVNARGVGRLSDLGWTALMFAADRGDASMVRYLLDHGADPNIADDGGYTALHCAGTSAAAAFAGLSSQGPEVATLLLAHGASVNARSDRGRTALHVAASCGHTDLVKTLIARGAEIDARDEEDNTPLMKAASRPHGPTVEALLAAGSDRDLENQDGKTAWLLALETGAPLPLDLLKPTRVDANRALASRLLGAVGRKDAAAVRELLAAGADPNSLGLDWFGDGGISPLMRAAATGATEIVLELLKHQADVNTRGQWGRTALTLVSWFPYERVDMVQLLLAHGADVNLPDNQGRTPLVHAVANGHKAIAEALLAAGATVDPMGAPSSPLCIAAGQCPVELVQLLISHGADVNARTSDGQTALQCARQRGREEIVAPLRRAGARR